MIDERIIELAEAHCYPRQLQVWKLHHIHGMSLRGIAHHLGLNRTGVVDAYDSACTRLLKQGVRVDASGQPYLEETNVA